MTRREFARLVAGACAFARRLRAQAVPDSFKVYSETPRLLLRPARLRLLQRERERRELRWDQFETLWNAGAGFPEIGWIEALRYQVADEREAGTRAVAWAAGPGDDIRQIALIADWCAPITSKDDQSLIFGKLRKELTDNKPLKTLAEARDRVFAAIVLADAQPAASEKALQQFFEGFWMGSLIPGLRNAKTSVASQDAYPMLEIMHAVRDNLSFDLRETFPKWFEQYPLLHLMAHYPAPWPGSENEFRIPADETIEKRGPDVWKATLSRAAELAMIAYDTNTASSQLLQGWVTNDRFLMRGAAGIGYEFLWANPYQPGLSYHHVPLAFHDEIGGQLFVRSSWEDDAAWAGFFAGQLQLFADGSVSAIDPRLSHEPLDLESAVVFFARDAKRFRAPASRNDVTAESGFNIFLVGLEPGKAYHVEVDGEEMSEERADPGGIIYLSRVPAGAGVRLNPMPVIS
ncbi:MAG TPA: hypothetical protein VEF06_04465 [Bryobacteraceae bacterium]|nr:hypothetical protein [Bryobacteraceae bacterium]